VNPDAFRHRFDRPARVFARFLPGSEPAVYRGRPKGSSHRAAPGTSLVAADHRFRITPTLGWLAASDRLHGLHWSVLALPWYVSARQASAARRSPALIHIIEAGDFHDLSGLGNWVTY